MRLLSYESGAGPRPGAMLDESQVLDIRQAADAAGHSGFRSLLEIIERGDAALDTISGWMAVPLEEAVIPLADIRFLAPLPVPQQIRDFANYEAHCLAAMEASMRLRASKADDPDAEYERLAASGAYRLPDVWYDIPLYYKGNRFATSGHCGTIEWPAFSDFLDYELELACVIGSTGRDIPEARAHEHIFGYTIFNDFSARDVQARWEGQFRMGPAKGKDFDTSNAFGPWIVTRDEIPDPYNLDMCVRINGEVRATGNSGGSQHNFEQCIAQVSRSETLHPGEILGLGTIPGGCGFETLEKLSPGDVVELEVEGIGKLSSKISARGAVQ